MVPLSEGSMVLALRTLGSSHLRTLRPWDPRTLGPSDLGTLGPWDPATLGPSDLGTFGPSLLHRNFIAGFESRRRSNHDAIAGLETGQHFEPVAIGAARPHRALVDRIASDDENKILIAQLDHGGFWYQRRRSRVSRVLRVRIAQERHLDAHIRQDARIQGVEADAHEHGGLLSIG